MRLLVVPFPLPHPPLETYEWPNWPKLASQAQKISLNQLFSVVFFCPPPFRRKAEGHCFWFSVVRGSEFLVGTLSP